MGDLRLRMKVWTNPDNGELYLVAVGYYSAKTDLMSAYAMQDKETKQIELTPEEWNALPYKYFSEDGDAPRPTKKFSLDRAIGGVVTP